MQSVFTTEDTERTEKTLLKYVFLSGAAGSVKACSSCNSEDGAQKSKTACTTEGTERTEKTVFEDVSLQFETAFAESVFGRIGREAAWKTTPARAVTLFEKALSVLSVSSVVNAFPHREQPACS